MSSTLTNEASSPAARNLFLQNVEDFLQTESLDEKDIQNTIAGLVEYGCIDVKDLRESAGYPPDNVLLIKKLSIVGVLPFASDLLFEHYVANPAETNAVVGDTTVAMAGNGATGGTWHEACYCSGLVFSLHFEKQESVLFIIFCTDDCLLSFIF